MLADSVQSRTAHDITMNVMAFDVPSMEEFMESPLPLQIFVAIVEAQISL